ncbi:MAG: phosphopentomutase [Syntrophomonadaceae bacterium]
MLSVFKRAILIILDSVGIGASEDAYLYGDEGSNTLKNTACAVGGLNLPHLARLGLGNLDDLMGVAPVTAAQGAFGKMKERSKGKDTTTGHWEITGQILHEAFPTYPHGFPLELIQEFEKLIGTRILGNKVASGTEIIQELGPEHIETGYPIVYTSADSVFQIAAHEEIIPLERLYEICRIARRLLTGEHGVGRVIARPFVGSAGSFIRTSNRHDFSREPNRNVLDYIIESGQEVVGIGKIKDIFAGRGISSSLPIRNNRDGVNKIISTLKNDFKGLVFANLIDFDQLYGHRNDAHGYASALEEFDAFLPDLMAAMLPEDMLVITADHGCDPTTASTDHSREHVPLLVYGQKLKAGVDLGLRSSFADVGRTIADHLEVEVKEMAGESFYSLIK